MRDVDKPPINYVIDITTKGSGHLDTSIYYHRQLNAMLSPFLSRTFAQSSVSLQPEQTPQ